MAISFSILPYGNHFAAIPHYCAIHVSRELLLSPKMVRYADPPLKYLCFTQDFTLCDAPFCNTISQAIVFRCEYPISQKIPKHIKSGICDTIATRICVK